MRARDRERELHVGRERQCVCVCVKRKIDRDIASDGERDLHQDWDEKQHDYKFPKGRM